MIIERIQIFEVAMPLLYPWRTAYGEDSAVHSVVVHLFSDDLDSWGEACPFERPEYSAEWAGGAFELIRKWFAPALVGYEIEGPRGITAELGRFKGNQFAKAAIEMAAWDLRSTQTQQPLHMLLGGKRDRVEVGADFGVMDNLGDLLAAIDGSVMDGYRRVKLKFRPGWDVEMVRTVRDYFPELTIHIDCNSGYTLNDLDLFKALDPLHLHMIEQPLAHDDLVDHAKLQRIIDTPICLDESVNSLRRALTAIELGSCRFMNVKPGRVGGISVACDIHDVCADADIACWVGVNLESAIGSSHAVALATLPNFSYPADIFPSSRMYETELASPEVEFTAGETGGRYVVADGRLRQPVQAHLERMVVQHAEVRPAA